MITRLHDYSDSCSFPRCGDANMHVSPFSPFSQWLACSAAAPSDGDPRGAQTAARDPPSRRAAARSSQRHSRLMEREGAYTGAPFMILAVGLNLLQDG